MASLLLKMLNANNSSYLHTCLLLKPDISCFLSYLIRVIQKRKAWGVPYFNLGSCSMYKQTIQNVQIVYDLYSALCVKLGNNKLKKKSANFRLVSFFLVEGEDVFHFTPHFVCNI